MKGEADERYLKEARQDVVCFSELVPVSFPKLSPQYRHKSQMSSFVRRGFSHTMFCDLSMMKNYEEKIESSRGEDKKRTFSLNGHFGA